MHNLCLSNRDIKATNTLILRVALADIGKDDFILGHAFFKAANFLAQRKLACSCLSLLPSQVPLILTPPEELPPRRVVLSLHHAGLFGRSKDTLMKALFLKPDPLLLLRRFNPLLK